MPQSEDVPRLPTTRERLLRAAIELIAEQGWGAVTTRMVADRAGVNQALVHYHYRSVPGLLREAAFVAMSAAFEPATVRLLEAGDALTGLLGAIDAVAQIDPGTPESRVAIEATVQAVRDPELNAQMRQMLPMFRGLLTDLLAAGQAAGQVRAEVRPAGLAIAIAAMLDGLALHRLVDPDTDIGEAAAALLALLGDSVTDSHDMARPARGDPAGGSLGPDPIDEGGGAP